MILALLVACKGSDPEGEGTQWSAIEGTLEVDYTVGDFSVCDGTVSFTGVPYPKLQQMHDDLFNYGPASFHVEASATLRE